MGGLSHLTSLRYCDNVLSLEGARSFRNMSRLQELVLSNVFIEFQRLTGEMLREFKRNSTAVLR